MEEELDFSENEEEASEFTETDVIYKLINSPPKGIFLLDETPPAVGLRLAELDKPNTLTVRQLYYKLFISALEPQYISAVSVSHECLLYTFEEDLITKLGDIMLGVRLDMGISPLNYRTRKECYTEGLTWVPKRLELYKKKGCVFTRWRSVYTVGDNVPTCFCISENCKSQAKFAVMSQFYELIPIVEIELLKDGDYSLTTGSKALEKILAALVKTLVDENVCINKVILQVSLVSGGKDANEIYKSEDIATSTIEPMKRTLPVGLGGVLISSGGMSEEESTLALSNLMEIVNTEKSTIPWPITFGFGRALQHSALKIWKGNEKNQEIAQSEFIKRQEANIIAMGGKYIPDTGVTASANDNLDAEVYIY